MANDNAEEAEKREKQKKIDARNDNLMIMRLELDKRAVRIVKDHEMHQQRRIREAEIRANENAKMKDAGIKRKNELAKAKVLAEELEALKMEELRQMKIKQKLMDSPEIKDLQLQLRTAYIRKELQAQIEARRLEKMKSFGAPAAERKEIEDLVRCFKEEELVLQQEENNKKLKYRQTLQDQMINKYKEKQERYKESLKDRALLNDALRCVLEEDQMELQREFLKREKIKKEILAFKQAKAIWTLREKQVQEEEERQINEYLDRKEKQEEEQAKKTNVKTQNLTKCQEIVANIFSQNKNTMEEHNNVIQLIAEEQERQKSEERELEALRKEMRAKQELRDAFARQIDDRLQRLYLLKLEEQDYVRKKMEEYEEDRKLQQMTAQKKRMMKLEYRLCVQKELEERQLRRKREEEELSKWRKMQEKAVEKRIKLVEEERLKLLKDHSAGLLGFLPPGSLRPSDLPHMPPDVKEFYSPKPQPLGQPQR